MSISELLTQDFYARVWGPYGLLYCTSFENSTSVKGYEAYCGMDADRVVIFYERSTPMELLNFTVFGSSEDRALVSLNDPSFK